MARSIERSSTAVAPCSTANLGPGYDVFGLALNGMKDVVKIRRVIHDFSAMKQIGNMSALGKKRINMKVSGSRSEAIPISAESNSAGLAVMKMAGDFGIEDQLEIEITKGIPAGFGLGSSAASAAAAAVAFDRLFDLRIDKTRLVHYAAEGEIASAGIKHYDNVAASLLGGFIIVGIASDDQKPRFTKIEPPSDLGLVVAVPNLQVPKKKTGVARGVLPSLVPLRSVIHNVSNASTIVAGFASKDVQLIANGMNDAIVEPARQHLIPGFSYVRKNAQNAGALAVAISGAGPSVVSFLKTDESWRKVASAMKRGFKESGIISRTYLLHPGVGAKVVSATN